MIKRSEYAGFCFGVKRAADLIDSCLSSTDKTVYTLGELIHNDDYNKSLVDRGVVILNGVEELEDVSPDSSIVFIRAHGATKETYDYLDSRGFEYIDATCPFVENIHKIVLREKEADDPFFVIIGPSSRHKPRGSPSLCCIARQCWHLPLNHIYGPSPA